MGKRVRDIVLAAAEIASDGKRDDRRVSFRAVQLANGGDLQAAVDLLTDHEGSSYVLWEIMTLLGAREYEAAEKIIAAYRANKVKALRSG